MIDSLEINTVLILTSSTLHLITLLESFVEDAHPVHACSSSSRLTRSSFFFLLNVVSFLARSWLLIFLPAWGAQPSLTPFPRADPISLGSQATPHSHVGHNLFVKNKLYYVRAACGRGSQQLSYTWNSSWEKLSQYSLSSIVCLQAVKNWILNCL